MLGSTSFHPTYEGLLSSRQKITYNVGWVVACFHEVVRSETQPDAGFRPSTQPTIFR
ncbi:MAG: hypothetical protein QNJ51_00990 [Calothrix sp. MO_167.B12]|nr:hypothetical protein [Calothrix sp. MO_167.B12]